MLGLSLAVAANFFWAAVNIIDKHLVTRFCKNGSIASLLILSSLFPIVLIPLAFLLKDSSATLTTFHIAVLITSGVFTTGWMYFYFSALMDDDVSTVIPLFQLTPVFGLVCAFFILKEVPTLIQIGWASLILLGSLMLSIEQSTGRMKLKLIANLMAATLLIALMSTFFKYVAIDSDFWSSLLWQSVGTVLSGILLMFHSGMRTAFANFVEVNLGIGITLNAINETLALVGNVIFAYAVLLAPLALVQTMGAYHPIFVLLLVLLLAKLFPSLSVENIPSSILLKKVIGIVFVITGSLFLALS